MAGLYPLRLSFLFPFPEFIDDSEGQQWNGMDMAVAKKK